MGMQSQIAERKGKVAPKAKDKQDEAIIGTNDYSIVSKRSVEKFYYKNEPQFLRAFVHKFKRRAPLVNRGYWLRMRAIEAVVQRFLNETTDKPKAIVNLGCGYEPLAFRMLWKYPQQCRDVKFVDMDFPPLIAKKVAMIKREPLLQQQLDVNEDEELIHPSVYYANRKYCAVACDLGDQALLRQVLNDRLHLDKNAILFVSEVAIVYMPPDEATNVISICSTFPDARICVFEQCLPAGQGHPFARTMHDHFRRTPLRGLTSFPTIESQRDRFANLGWQDVQVADLWSVWQNEEFIDDSERTSLDTVEPFDEWEGLALWAGHNFLLLATTQEARTATYEWIRAMVKSTQNDSSNPSSQSVSAAVKSNATPRGHGRINGIAITRGESQLMHHGGTALETRQGSADVYTSASQETIPMTEPPINLSFATSVSSGAGNSFFVGGRTSPLRANSNCYSSTTGQWKQEAELLPGRYRHSAAAVEIHGRKAALVFGGKTSDGQVLNDWKLFYDHEWRDVEVRGLRPPPLFGAAMVAITSRSGVIIGGLDQSGRLGADQAKPGFWHWTLYEQQGESIMIEVKYVPVGNPGSSAARSIQRFGAVALNRDLEVVLIGGIGPQGPLQPEEEILRLDISGTVSTCNLALEQNVELPMFIGCSAIASTNDGILVVGGGTICFSYGSFWNSSILQIDFGDVDHYQREKWRLVLNNAAAPVVTKSNPTNTAGACLQGIQVQKINGTKAAVRISRETRQPYVLQSLDLGPCTRTWAIEYLKAAVGTDTPTVIHSAVSRHLSFTSKNFRYDTVPFGSFLDKAAAGSHVYMRALSTSAPSKAPANLKHDYPKLHDDFKLPNLLSFAREHEHSSVLRISGDINMWLHYDVMSNVLCQINGSKRVILFPPKDVSHLSFAPGESTSSIDVFRAEAMVFSDCSPLETILRPGDVLFIPACWPHATAPASGDNGLSVAVNVFFKSLEDKFYAAGRDVYGNRDLQMYENGRKHIAKVKELLKGTSGARKDDRKGTLVAALKGQDRANEEQIGGKAVNRIIASSQDLPDDLANFYLQRLANELA